MFQRHSMDIASPFCVGSDSGGLLGFLMQPRAICHEVITPATFVNHLNSQALCALSRQSLAGTDTHRHGCSVDALLNPNLYFFIRTVQRVI